MLKKIGWALVVVLVGIQFVRPARNVSAAGAGPNDITLLHPTSADVKAILARACYDCHSDNTRYPWYAEVQPVRWWLDHHVNDGKRHLNFSQFGTYTPKRAAKKLRDVVEETKERKMPMTSYTLIHRDAVLTEADIAALGAWSETVQARLPAP